MRSASIFAQRSPSAHRAPRRAPSSAAFFARAASSSSCAFVAFRIVGRVARQDVAREATARRRAPSPGARRRASTRGSFSASALALSKSSFADVEIPVGQRRSPSLRNCCARADRAPRRCRGLRRLRREVRLRHREPDDPRAGEEHERDEPPAHAPRRAGQRDLARHLVRSPARRGTCDGLDAHRLRGRRERQRRVDERLIVGGGGRLLDVLVRRCVRRQRTAAPSGAA